MNFAALLLKMQSKVVFVSDSQWRDKFQLEFLDELISEHRVRIHENNKKNLELNIVL